MEHMQFYYRSALERLDYLKAGANFEGFDPLEQHWSVLLGWAMSLGRSMEYYNKDNKPDGTMYDIWCNQLLTILVEIKLTDTCKYKQTFINSSGTVRQLRYTESLRRRISDWAQRLGAFLSTGMHNNLSDDNSVSVKIARQVKTQLQNAICPLRDQSLTCDLSTQPYYNMLRMIDEISEQFDCHMEQIEMCGEVDPSLAMLLVFARNYGDIVERFNSSVSLLPELYRGSILHATPQSVTADSTFLVLTPDDAAPEFDLPAGWDFVGGKNSNGTDVTYRTTTQAPITHLKLDGAATIYLAGKTVQKQPLNFSTPLFDAPAAKYNALCGMMICSPMFNMSQGERKTDITLALTNSSVLALHDHMDVLAGKDIIDFFDLQISCPDGWYSPERSIRLSDDLAHLHLAFTLPAQAPPTSVCLPAIHGYATAYPSVRLTCRFAKESYDWAVLTNFNSATIQVAVSGLSDIRLSNNQGQTDIPQPFHPFGMQGQAGTSFTVTCDETATKPLTEVALNGVWNVLPCETKGYTDRYVRYCMPPITNRSFKILCQWQQDGAWVASQEPTELFSQIGEAIDENAHIVIPVNDCCAQFFRITLAAPDIGFGTEAYRQLFASTMVYNSRHRRRPRALVKEPVVPMLSQITLSYQACQTISIDAPALETAFYRISPIYPTGTMAAEGQALPLVEPMELPCNIMLTLGNTNGCGIVRLFFDVAASASDPTPLIWRVHDGQMWHTATGQSVITDQTAGLTQSGFVELMLDKPASQQQLTIMASFADQTGLCPNIRGIYTNCIFARAVGGDGLSLPAQTIAQSVKALPWPCLIVQPIASTGGCPVESASQTATRLSYRCANRNRACLPSDYQQLIIANFPSVSKVCCLPRSACSAQELHIVVFSRAQGDLYPYTTATELAAIAAFLQKRISPLVNIVVTNPVYEPLHLSCRVVPKKGAHTNVIVRRMSRRIQNYFAKWLTTQSLPQINRQHSFKALQTILANDYDVSHLTELTVTVNDRQYTIPDINHDTRDIYIKASNPWNVLIPNNPTIEMVDPNNA